MESEQATIKDRLQTDLTASMKARDELATSTLRMLRAAITNAEVAGAEAIELTDEQTIAVLSAMKIEHKLTAGIDGVVAELAAAAGATVEQGTVLARIAPQGQPPPQKPAPNEKT